MLALIRNANTSRVQDFVPPSPDFVHRDAQAGILVFQLQMNLCFSATSLSHRHISGLLPSLPIWEEASFSTFFSLKTSACLLTHSLSLSWSCTVVRDSYYPILLCFPWARPSALWSEALPTFSCSLSFNLHRLFPNMLTHLTP